MGLVTVTAISFPAGQCASRMPVTVMEYVPPEVVDVLLTVRVALAAVVPEMVTDAGTLQVTGLVAPEGPDTACSSGARFP